MEPNGQYNLFKTCRSCLTVHGTMLDVLSSGERERNLLRIYVGIVNSEVAKSEYPFLLCQQCESKLLHSHALLNQCRKSNAAIEKILIEKADNAAMNDEEIVKEESNITYESEDDSSLCNIDETDSYVDKKGDVGGDGRSKLKQFPRDEVLEVINDLSKALPAQFTNCIFCLFKAKSSSGITNHVRLVHSDVKNKWCSICNEVYEDFSIHSQSHPSENFKCKFCNKDVMRKDDLIVHLRSHACIRPYKCIECGKDFVTKSHLRNHDRMHKGLKLYQCAICNRNFVQSQGLKRHLRTHADVDDPNRIETNNFCDVCNRRVLSLREHQLRFHKDITIKSEHCHPCSICGKQLSSSSNLVAHMRSHTRESPFKCQFCNKGMTTRNHLVDHERTHTGEKPFNCKICDKEFSQHSVLKAHMFLHTGKLQCNICDNRYTRTSDLTVHMREHTGERPYECKECGKGFTGSNYLAYHMKSHSTQRPFQCNYCPLSFKRKSTLKQHEDIHTGEKRYQCTECGKSFLRNTALTQHMKTHTKEKPFQCSYCPLSFKRKPALKVHEDIHTGERRKYECYHCPFSYNYRYAIIRHLKKHGLFNSNTKSA